MLEYRDFNTIDPVMQYVISEMNDEHRRQIIKDHAEFIKNGFIGESVLRSAGNMVRDNRDYISITTCMDWVVNSVYKYYTMKYFKVI